MSIIGACLIKFYNLSYSYFYLFKAYYSNLFFSFNSFSFYLFFSSSILAYSSFFFFSNSLCSSSSSMYSEKGAGDSQTEQMSLSQLFIIVQAKQFQGFFNVSLFSESFFFLLTYSSALICSSESITICIFSFLVAIKACFESSTGNPMLIS